jgi:hypothetical protein
MGNYAINDLKKEVQSVIQAQGIDKNGDGRINSDNGELSELLSNTNANSIEDLLQIQQGYEVNNKSNSFLKEYIEKLASSSNVQIPDGMQIQISSPKEVSDDYKQLLKYVRKNIYEARIADMMNLLSQDKSNVSERVQEMKISDEDKNKIIELKKMFDEYYNIKVEYNGKSIDLLNPTEDDIEYLKNNASEFSSFIEKQRPELKKQVVNFAQKEIEGTELSEAGFWSRVGAPVVMGIMGLGLYRGFKETKDNAKMKKDMSKFLQEQQEIYKAGRPKFVNPLKAYKTAFQGAKKGGKFGLFALGGTVLASYLWKTLMGSLDDLSGCVKDAVQDTDNFGLGWGLGIAIPSAIAGVLSSAFISPTIDAHIEYNRAEKQLIKNGILPKAKGLSKLAKYGAKGLIGAGLGCIIAACSSGSSWASMAGTRMLFGLKGNKLEEKNIITKDENTSQKATENMMKYEAYYGKWDGIAKGDPTIGSIGGGLGLFTHTNPILQNLSFGLQGCSETLTACGVQLLGDEARKSKLDSEKEDLVKSAK